MVDTGVNGSSRCGQTGLQWLLSKFVGCLAEVIDDDEESLLTPKSGRTCKRGYPPWRRHIEQERAKHSRETWGTALF